MKSRCVKILIVILIIIVVIFVDTLQALMFNNDPILGVSEVQDEYLKTKRSIFISSETYCNYYRIIYFNGQARFMHRLYKGCEGDNAKYLIKDNITNLTNSLGDISNYDIITVDNNGMYEILMGLVASPKFIEELYENNEFTSKEAYVAARIIEDITKCDITKEFNQKWENADEFFKLWHKSQCKTKKKLYKALAIYE